MQLINENENESKNNTSYNSTGQPTYSETESLILKLRELKIITRDKNASLLKRSMASRKYDKIIKKLAKAMVSQK